MSIYCIGPKRKPPYKIALELTCDRCKGGFIRERTVQVFKGPDYPAIRTKATRAGWKETYKRGKRLFIGPCCMGG